MLGRRIRLLKNRLVGDLDAPLEGSLYRLDRPLRHFVPPSVHLAQYRLGRNRARERAGCRATNAISNDEDEGSGVDRDERWRAHRRDVARLQIRNHKGVLIVVPDQPDIRTPENLCKQLWLEKSVVYSRRSRKRAPAP